MKSVRAILAAPFFGLVVLAGWPSAASGATETFVELKYEADPSCMGEGELRRMVQEQLHHDPFRRDAEQHVIITIQKTEAGFEGRVTWTEATGRVAGERLLSSSLKDCREIAANVAFAVAVQLELIEAGASETAGAASSAAEASPAKPPAESGGSPSPQPPIGRLEAVERPTTPAELPRGPATPSPMRLALVAGVGTAVGAGIAPGPTAIGRVFASVELDRVSAEIAAAAALPVTRWLADGSGVAVSGMAASLAACGRMSPIVACLVGQLGHLQARGVGVDAPREPSATFAQLGARLGLTGNFGPVIASFHADGLWMLSDWNVALNQAVVWSVPRLGGLAGIDVGMHFF